MMNRTHALTLTAALTASMLAGACSKPPEAAVTPPVAVAAGNVSDIDVTEHVRTALLQSESLKGVDIQVATLKGDVRLTGVLDSQAQVDEVPRIARAADGAHAVHDELTVRK